VRILRVFERNTSDVRIFFYHLPIFAGSIMSYRNNTPPPHDVELKFQMQAMTKMMEIMNFMMGNVCDRLEKVGKHGNMAGTCTQDVRKVGAKPKSNNGNGAERPR
jgi:hypothetical protein